MNSAQIIGNCVGGSLESSAVEIGNRDKRVLELVELLGDGIVRLGIGPVLRADGEPHRGPGGVDQDRRPTIAGGGLLGGADEFGSLGDAFLEGNEQMGQSTERSYT